MNIQTAFVDDFTVSVIDDLPCPCCTELLSPHGAEHYAPDAWRLLCSRCHADILVIAPRE
jgi:hypothetical protein